MNEKEYLKIVTIEPLDERSSIGLTTQAEWLYNYKDLSKWTHLFPKDCVLFFEGKGVLSEPRYMFLDRAYRLAYELKRVAVWKDKTKYRANLKKVWKAISSFTDHNFSEWEKYHIQLFEQIVTSLMTLDEDVL